MWKIYSSIKLSGNVQTCQELSQWCRQNWAKQSLEQFYFSHFLHTSGFIDQINKNHAFFWNISVFNTWTHIDHGYLLILLFSYTYKKNWVQWTLLMMDMRMPYYGTWMDFQVLMKYQWTCVCSPNPLTTPHRCQKCFFVQVNSGWIGKWHNTSHEDTKAGAEVVWQIPFNTH